MGRVGVRNFRFFFELPVILTRGDRNMSVKITLCRGFLEHIDLTLTDKTFQVGSSDYYLPIEQKQRPDKRYPTDFWPFS